MHNISHENDVEVVPQSTHNDEDEQQTVKDDDSQATGKRSSLKIFNHGSVKIKYAAGENSSRPGSNANLGDNTDRQMQDSGDYIVDQPLNELKHDASKASSNEAPDSFNERQ